MRVSDLSEEDKRHCFVERVHTLIEVCGIQPDPHVPSALGNHGEVP